MYDNVWLDGFCKFIYFNIYNWLINYKDIVR